ncbi:MAG: CRISPR-associated endoribonuclease Cas6 [Moorellaceae bacterium]
MRLTVFLNADGDFGLPVEYNYLLQAALYQQIEQPALRNFLHEQGFELGRRKFKLFTFSRLQGRLRVDKAGSKMIFSPPVRFTVCSPLSYLVQEMGNGFLKQGRIRLGEALLEVEKVEVAETVVREREIGVQMLSPLVVYSTLESSGARYTYYYSPFEPRFGELVLANLAKKYLLIFGRPADTRDFSIVPVEVGEKDFKIVKYKGTVIKGWMGTYRLQGDPQLLEVGLSAGLGSKNSQGFGCCEHTQPSI